MTDRIKLPHMYHPAIEVEDGGLRTLTMGDLRVTVFGSVIDGSAIVHITRSRESGVRVLCEYAGEPGTLGRAELPVK